MTTKSYGIIILFLWALVGCDQLFNKAGLMYFKATLTEVCGKEDAACIVAVEEQFDPCHKKYIKEWNAYMKAPSSKEDELLVVYSEDLYSCIVDAQGDPYFEFNSMNI